MSFAIPAWLYSNAVLHVWHQLCWGVNYNLPSQTSFLSALHLKRSHLLPGATLIRRFGVGFIHSTSSTCHHSHILARRLLFVPANWWKCMNSLFFSVFSVKNFQKIHFILRGKPGCIVQATLFILLCTRLHILGHSNLKVGIFWQRLICSVTQRLNVLVNCSVQNRLELLFIAI